MQNAILKTSAANDNDHEVLLELNRNYVRSAQESDVGWYAENLSDDFYITAGWCFVESGRVSRADG